VSGRSSTPLLFGSLRGYRVGWLRADLVAGVTVWAVLVPESLAYATIAGVPPVVGLYAAVPALVLYALLGSSRHLVVASMSATAALSAGIIGDLARGGSDRYVALTAALAIVTGGVGLAAGLARMGFLASFISAHTWIDAEYEKVFHPFTPTARWALPALPELITATEANFEQPDAYPVDARGVAYSFAFFSSKHLGKGQFSLMTIADEDGKALDGASTYRLTVPAGAPVTQYWSVTVYDRATHTLIRDTARAGCSSQAENLTVNDDGSTDIYFGPTTPAGSGPNWVPTDPGGHFEALFRFYGPTPSLYDHTWRLPDMEQIPAAR
jgi:hypothetical protein